MCQMQYNTEEWVLEKQDSQLNQLTEHALAEYEEMKRHPEIYKRYSNFKEALHDVLRENEAS